MNKILYPNCSESVFKFYVTDPQEIRKILQLIADEISANSGYEPHQNQKVPLFMNTKEYEGSGLLQACAGLGNDSVIRIGNGGFTLNIGNNDISQDSTGWVEAIEKMGIYVEEAEHSKGLEAKARDCTCGITYFDGYDKLITDENRKFTIVKKHPRTTKRARTTVRRHKRRLR
jgi:hypothetical protein